LDFESLEAQSITDELSRLAFATSEPREERLKSPDLDDFIHRLEMLAPRAGTIGFIKFGKNQQEHHDVARSWRQETP
jgi:hypothetical protein